MAWIDPALIDARRRINDFILMVSRTMMPPGIGMQAKSHLIDMAKAFILKTSVRNHGEHGEHAAKQIPWDGEKAIVLFP